MADALVYYSANFVSGLQAQRMLECDASDLTIRFTCHVSLEALTAPSRLRLPNISKGTPSLSSSPETAQRASFYGAVADSGVLMLALQHNSPDRAGEHIEVGVKNKAAHIHLEKRWGNVVNSLPAQSGTPLLLNTPLTGHKVTTVYGPVLPEERRRDALTANTAARPLGRTFLFG